MARKRRKLMERSLEGKFYQDVLRKRYKSEVLENLRGIEYIPRMLELLHTPLSEAESLSVLGMIGTRLHKFYSLFEWEFTDRVTMFQLRNEYTEFLGSLPYRWPEEPKVICDETNNYLGELWDKRIWVDIWFKVRNRTLLYHIQLSDDKINCYTIDPYNVKEQTV
jgi:hypothetical protein